MKAHTAQFLKPRYFTYSSISIEVPDRTFQCSHTDTQISGLDNTNIQGEIGL